MATMRNIKIWISIVCLATSLAAPAPAPPLTLDIIDMAAISRMTPQQLEALAEGLAAEEIMRTKRSSQALTSVVSKASSGLQSKVGILGQASAGVAGLVSSASSKSGHEGYSYEPPQQEMKYDFFGLKKSILYTLFQAVKAITGGVTILKGQLIKGGGALAATLGKVISSKGDVVSNLGKKIVSSAALSQKKPAPPVYGPPPPIHAEYPPSAYGAPSAPAQYHSALSAPTGYSSHKYPAHLDGRNKLNGLHAGLVLLTPVGGEAPVDYHGGYPAHPGHTPLDPPPSLIHNAVSAIKNALASAPSYVEDPSYQAPPPLPSSPLKPTGWGGPVNSYGEPAPSYDSYADYDPRNNKNDQGNSKKYNIIPKIEYQGLTSEKLEKINSNLDKLASYINENKRSFDGPSDFTGLESLKKAVFLPTPVSYNEVGVLPAEYLPTEPVPTLTSAKTTTTTLKPTVSTEATRRKDVKFFLRGNKIVQV